MLKYKGLFIPKADSESSGKVGKTLKKKFCHKAKIEDCRKIECDECLFFDCRKIDFPKYPHEAFVEWFKAKGQVKHD